MHHRPPVRADAARRRRTSPHRDQRRGAHARVQDAEDLDEQRRGVVSGDVLLGGGRVLPRDEGPV